MDAANPTNGTRPPKKRRRLNFACEECRARKVRCDQLQPACYNCLSRGTSCVTVDKRRPGVAVQRHEAGRVGPAPPNTSPPRTALFSHEASSLSVSVETEPAEALSGAPTSAPISATTAAAIASPTTAAVAPPTTPPAADDVHLTPDSHAQVNFDGTLKFSGRLPLLPQGGGRSSVELLTDWLNVAVHRLGLRNRLAPKSLLRSLSGGSDHGLGGLGGVDGPFGLPSLTGPPELPPRADAHRLLSLYFCHVNAVFGLLRHGKTVAMLDRVYTVGTDAFLREHGLAPLLQLYLILSLGSLACRDLDSSTSTFRRDSVSFAQNILGHIVGWNTIEAVQALFLLVLCFRAQDRTFLSWSTLGTCVVMAVSLGLNRKLMKATTATVTEPTTTPSEDDLERQRTWWCIYSLEKLHAFELGMVSSIVDHDCSQPDPDTDELSVLVGFARCLSTISREIIAVRNKEERSITERALMDKATTSGKACLNLLNWSETVDIKFRPTSTVLGGPRPTVFTVFLTLAFNNALIMVTRNSMLLCPGVLRRYLGMVGRDKPWCHLLDDRNTVAANAARRIIGILVETTEIDFGSASGPDSNSGSINSDPDSSSNSDLALLSVINPLHATYILIVQTINNPRSRRASLDIALLEHAREFALLQCRKFSHSSDTRLDVLLQTLMSFLSQYVQADRDKNRDGSSRSSTALSVVLPDVVSNALPHILPGILHADSPAGLPTASPPVPDWSGWDWPDFNELLSGPLDVDLDSHVDTRLDPHLGLDVNAEPPRPVSE